MFGKCHTYKQRNKSFKWREEDKRDFEQRKGLWQQE